MRFGFFSLLLALALASIWPCRAEACSVPVFRYALERWQPDLFQALVLYRGALSDEQKKSLGAFDRSEGENQANLELVMVDLDDSPPPELLTLLEQQKETTLPRILLMPPPFTGAATPLWSGGLGDKKALATFNNIVDSPVRRKTVKRLLAGNSAVWLCIESGNREMDDKAFKLLENHLKKLEKEMKLPEQDPQDLLDPAKQVRFEKLPVHIAFSTLRVSRTDLLEKGLIDQLMKTEDDLDEEIDKPMVFPVFGRGRALWAYIGAGINEDNITEAAQFLVGPCSCEIKRQNPGSDLLLTADWEGSLEGLIETREVELPPLSGLEGFTIEDGEDLTSDSSGGTTAEVTLVPKPAEPDKQDKPAVAATTVETPPGKTPEQEKPAVPAPAEKETPAPAEPEPETGEEASVGSDSLAENMLILGIVGFALLAGVTILIRKKQ